MTRRAHLLVVLLGLLATAAGWALWDREGAMLWLAGFSSLCG
jgi:hypothetical protein